MADIKLKNGKVIPAYNKRIAHQYINAQGNIISVFNAIERQNKQRKKIKVNRQTAYLEAQDIEKANKLEQRWAMIKAFSIPQRVRKYGKSMKIYNLGAGINPFIAMYIDNHRYEIQRPHYTRGLIQ
jgi:hypothetical protein